MWPRGGGWRGGGAGGDTNVVRNLVDIWIFKSHMPL